ncbi:MAG: hypothetical protein Q6362_003300 [Candidatus Wukongarchaeota archaeon]|nr:hypothetical protein [Candidatus Wukongarchaeota archaeon]
MPLIIAMIIAGKYVNVENSDTLDGSRISFIIDPCMLEGTVEL